jgi:hypothetical protein
MIDLEAIKRHAQAATPGPWTAKMYSEPQWAINGRGEFHFIAVTSQGHDQENAKHIAACDPQTVLALCAVVDAALRMSDEKGMACDCGIYDEQWIALRRALEPFGVKKT